MINDNTIDDNAATYWCMFMDKKIVKLLNDAMKYGKKDGKRLADIMLKVKDSKHFKESLKEGMWDIALVMHLSAFPLATGNPYLPNFRGMDPNSNELSLADLQKNNVIAGATTAALVGVSAVPGAWAALGSALTGTLGSVGGWLASTAASTAASIGTGGIMAIVGGIVSVSTYLYPRIAKALHEFGRDGTIAKCNFEADGQPYQAIFSASTGRWELVYTNNRWIRSGTKVQKNDVTEFFKSDFFRRFLKQCERYVLPVYSNEDCLECLKTLANMSDKASKKDLYKAIDAKDAVLNYMLKGKYIT